MAAKEALLECWEYKQCGREEGGSRVSTDGPCPANTLQAGQACWLVAGTFCGGEVQGSFADKRRGCMRCDFYRRFDIRHRARMNQRFGG